MGDIISYFFFSHINAHTKNDEIYEQYLQQTDFDDTVRFLTESDDDSVSLSEHFVTRSKCSHESPPSD